MALVLPISRIFPSWALGGWRVASCIRYPMVFTHLLLTLHCDGSLLVSHSRTVFAILGSTAAINEGISRGDSLKDFNASPNCFLLQFLLSLHLIV